MNKLKTNECTDFRSNAAFVKCYIGSISRVRVKSLFAKGPVNSVFVLLQIGLESDNAIF